MRLQKYMALSGVASRRKSEEIISAGRVKVNNQVVTELGAKVKKNDLIQVDNKIIKIEENKIYIILNKPVGYITSTKDQFDRKTIMNLISGIDERIYPVGRLDYDTSGLLLLTNDGDFMYKITHPKHEIKKTYLARVKGFPSKEAIVKFENGLKIDDYVTSEAKLKIIKEEKDTSLLEIVLHEGKNRQVRKMCYSIGHEVIDLKRIAIENLTIGDLKEGSWRILNECELIKKILK